MMWIKEGDEGKENSDCRLGVWKDGGGRRAGFEIVVPSEVPAVVICAREWAGE